MGLAESQSLGASAFGYILGGNFADGSLFHWDFYRNMKSSMDSRIHCLAIVLDSSQLDSVPEEVTKKIRDIRLLANQSDIPQAVLLTKVDQLCGARGGEDLVSLVFRSSAVEGAVSRAARMLGLPRAHVLPVQNYESEARLVPELDRLALLALSSLLHLVDDHLLNLPHEKPGSKEVEEIPTQRGASIAISQPRKLLRRCDCCAWLIFLVCAIFGLISMAWLCRST